MLGCDLWKFTPIVFYIKMICTGIEQKQFYWHKIYIKPDESWNFMSIPILLSPG